MPELGLRSDARSEGMSAQLGKSLGQPDRRPGMLCSVRPKLAVHKRTLQDLIWFPEPGILPREGHIFVVPNGNWKAHWAFSWLSGTTSLNPHSSVPRVSRRARPQPDDLVGIARQVPRLVITVWSTIEAARGQLQVSGNRELETKLHPLASQCLAQRRSPDHL